jgi:hypothetical protein
MVVTGATILPDTFPVQCVLFDTLAKASVTNITAMPISNPNREVNSPGNDSGFENSLNKCILQVFCDSR